MEDAPIEQTTAAPGEKRATRDGPKVRVWHLVHNGKIHRTYHTEAEAVEAAGSQGFFQIREDEL